MEAFGIEIRKQGSTDNLYKDVDLVLSRVGIDSTGGVSAEIQKQTVAHSLNKMLKSEAYFSIITIRECMQVCQVHVSHERLDVYKAIHCVKWSEMTPEYRQAIVAMVLDDFRVVLNC